MRQCPIPPPALKPLLLKPQPLGPAEPGLPSQAPSRAHWLEQDFSIGIVKAARPAVLALLMPSPLPLPPKVSNFGSLGCAWESACGQAVLQILRWVVWACYLEDLWGHQPLPSVPLLTSRCSRRKRQCLSDSMFLTPGKEISPLHRGAWVPLGHRPTHLVGKTVLVMQKSPGQGVWSRYLLSSTCMPSTILSTWDTEMRPSLPQATQGGTGKSTSGPKMIMPRGNGHDGGMNGV